MTVSVDLRENFEISPGGRPSEYIEHTVNKNGLKILNFEI